VLEGGLEVLTDEVDGLEEAVSAVLGWGCGGEEHLVGHRGGVGEEEGGGEGGGIIAPGEGAVEDVELQ